MAIVYSIPNQQEAETLAIRRVIRASNEENMARRRASDAARAREDHGCAGYVSSIVVHPTACRLRGEFHDSVAHRSV